MGENKKKAYEDERDVSVWTHDFLKVYVWADIMYVGIYVHSIYTHISELCGPKDKDKDMLVAMKND